MPPSTNSGSSDFLALLTIAFDRTERDIDEMNALWFKDGLLDYDNKTDTEAFIRLCMKTYERNKWTDETLTEYFREDFANVTEDQFKPMNGDLSRKFWDYLRGHCINSKE